MKIYGGFNYINKAKITTYTESMAHWIHGLPGMDFRKSNCLTPSYSIEIIRIIKR